MRIMMHTNEKGNSKEGEVNKWRAAKTQHKQKNDTSKETIILGRVANEVEKKEDYPLFGIIIVIKMIIIM